MSYEDKHGITDIKDGQHHNLCVSRDTGAKNEAVAVLLYTPDMQPKENGYVDHEHIELSVAQAKVLAEWLTKFVREHK